MLLALMMQHLLQAHQERARPPLAMVLEGQLEGRRVGPVKVSETVEAGRTRLSIRVEVLAGLPKKRIAESVGTAAWNHALANGAEPAEVVVEIGDDEHGPATVVPVARPPRRPGANKTMPSPLPAPRGASPPPRR